MTKRKSDPNAARDQEIVEYLAVERAHDIMDAAVARPNAGSSKRAQNAGRRATKKRKGKAPSATSCSAITRAGDPCPAPARRGLPTCKMHATDSQAAMEMQIARIVGSRIASMRGRNLRPGVKLHEPEDWQAVIVALVNDLASLPNTVARISAFVQLSNAAIAWRKEKREARTFELALEEGQMVEGFAS